MKRTVRVVANDGDVKVILTGHIILPNRRFAQSEVNTITRDVTRNLANSVQGVHYTDFGADNTRVVR